jgi:hypothetical protein
MGRKLTIELVRDEFEKAGLILLSTEYKNVSTKLQFECPKHPGIIQERSYNVFYTNKTCKICSSESRKEKTRIVNFDIVKSIFEDRGYILLSSERDYKDKSSKLKYICKKHPEEIQLTSHLNLNAAKEGCRFCKGETMSAQKRLDFSIVKSLFDEKGLTLLSKESEYINNMTKLSFICPNHPETIQYVAYSSLQVMKYCCTLCSLEGRASTRRLEYDYVKLEFEKRNYTLLDHEYINADTKMRYICALHPDHIQSVAYYSLKSGNGGCKYCGAEKIGEIFRKDIEEVRQKFIDNNMTPLFSEYKNRVQKLPYRCNDHPDVIQYTTYDTLHSGRGGCYLCNRISFGERKIRSILNDNNVKHKFQEIIQDCINIRPLRFDFWIPDKNIAIEYDGEQHFRPVKFGSMSYEKAVDNLKYTRHNDQIKNNYCLKNNIKLIRIPYWDSDKIEYILKDELII